MKCSRKYFVHLLFINNNLRTSLATSPRFSTSRKYSGWSQLTPTLFTSTPMLPSRSQNQIIRRGQEKWKWAWFKNFQFIFLFLSSYINFHQNKLYAVYSKVQFVCIVLFLKNQEVFIRSIQLQIICTFGESVKDFAKNLELSEQINLLFCTALTVPKLQ